MEHNQLLPRALAVGAATVVLASVVYFWPDAPSAVPMNPPSERGDYENDLRRLGLKSRDRGAVEVIDREPVAFAQTVAQNASDPKLEALHELAARDFPAALAEAKRLYADRDWKDVQARLASALLENDFARAPEILAQLESLVMQSTLMKVMPIVFRRNRAATATIVFDELTGRTKDFAAWNLARAQLNDGTVLAAMQTHLRMSSSSQSQQTATEIGAQITSGNLGAGLDWFAQIPSIDDRKSAHSRIAENLREAGDADGLLRLLAATPPEEPLKPGGTVRWNRDHLISGIARLRQLSGDQAGVEQLRVMLPDDEKDFVEVGLLYADQNQPLNERFARATALNGWARGTAVNAVIGKAVSDDPQNAARFVLSLNDNGYRGAVMSLIQAWKSKDASGVEEWLRGLPPGQQREQAIELAVIIYKYGRASEKERAREFAELAADEVQREKLRREIRGR